MEAQTKLRQINTAVVSQIKDPLTSLPGFSQRLKSCPGKSIGTGWIIPSTFPPCALSQFLVVFGAVAYVVVPQFFSCVVSL